MAIIHYRHVLISTTLCACMFCPGLLAPGTAEQSQQDRPISPPGTIRVRVQLVPVDVVVTDKNRKVVTDLRKEDFTILEDGRLQDIRHFSTQALQAGTADPAPPQLRKIPTLELTPQPSRTFLILLGRGRHQRFFKGVDALVEFVRNGLLPQDRVAVFAYNRATDFTTQHDRIARVLEQYKKIHEQIETRAELRFGGLGSIYGSRELPKEWQPDIDKIFAVEDGLNARQIPPGRITEEGKVAADSLEAESVMMADERRRRLQDRQIVAGRNLTERDPSATSALSAAMGVKFEQMEAGFITDLPFAEYASTSATTYQDVQNLFTCIEYLRYMEGEKHLLFFSGTGLFLPRLRSDRSIAAMASDARVAIDTFQTEGIRETPTAAERSAGFYQDPDMYGIGGRQALGLSWSRSAALTSLRNISELTGGSAAIHQYPEKALDRVNQTTRFEYLLGYYPAGPVWDGKFRTITVKVNRPGLTVQHRYGYFARDVLQPYDRREFLAYSRIASAASTDLSASGVTFEMDSSWEKDSSGKRQTLVRLRIDAHTVRFETVNGLHSGRLRIAIFCTDSDDRLMSDVWESLDLDLREETYKKALNEGIPYSVMMPVSPGRRNFKAIVYDIASDKTGSGVRHVK